MLLLDVFLLDDLQVIEESKSKGTMKVRGTFQRAEEANSNNRVYPKAVLENQINKLQPLITERRLCGELDHPQSDTVRLSNASHLVTKLWMESNEVYGEAEVLNTPAGKVAQALISDGVKIGISSRGLGTLSEGIYGKSKTVNDDFRLVTFDLVADPSTRGAYPALSESVMYTDEKYKRTLDQAISEKIFITMLKNRLNEDKKKDKVGEAANFKRWPTTGFPPISKGVSVAKGVISPLKKTNKKKRIPIPGDLGPNFHTKDHGIQDSNDVLIRIFRDRLDEFTDRRRQERMLARRKLAATIQKRLEKERGMKAPEEEEEEDKKKNKVDEGIPRRVVYRTGRSIKRSGEKAEIGIAGGKLRRKLGTAIMRHGEKPNVGTADPPRGGMPTPHVPTQHPRGLTKAQASVRKKAGEKASREHVPPKSIQQRQKDYWPGGDYEGYVDRHLDRDERKAQAGSKRRGRQTAVRSMGLKAGNEILRLFRDRMDEKRKTFMQQYDDEMKRRKKNTPKKPKRAPRSPEDQGEHPMTYTKHDYDED